MFFSNFAALQARYKRQLKFGVVLFQFYSCFHLQNHHNKRDTVKYSKFSFSELIQYFSDYEALILAVVNINRPNPEDVIFPSFKDDFSSIYHMSENNLIPKKSFKICYKQIDFKQKVLNPKIASFR